MTRPPLSTLSPTQQRVLEAVLQRERLRQPNFISDLVRQLGLQAESSLSPTLKRMERLGVLEVQGGGIQGRQRLVVSTERGRLLLASHTTPPFAPHGPVPQKPFSQRQPFLTALPVLGAIPAGPLEEVIAREDSESVAVESLLRAQPGDFLLRIQGHSMIGDGILEGDLVLLRPGIEVAAGEIAAVLFGGEDGEACEATLKRIFWRSQGKPVPARQGEEVLLRASNPAYPDLLLPAHSVRVAGVFRGLIRQEGSPR